MRPSRLLAHWIGVSPAPDLDVHHGDRAVGIAAALAAAALVAMFAAGWLQ